MVLLFLAAFYFLIATNTQSGWLFLLSAFLLGLLAMSWLPPRRAAGSVKLRREVLGSVQRDLPITVRLHLTNTGSRALREILVIEPANSWSKENSEFRWVVPNLGAGATVSVDTTLIPVLRGEHALAGSRLKFGAPFGLFTVEKSLPDSELFLVYPHLLTLSSARRQTRLAGILTEFTSPRSRGDSRSLRSLREYRTGDDLRLVHWKSSAKTGGTTLLVREHHAPSRQLGVLFLDTSRRDDSPESAARFEDSVTLTSSLLWSAHRSGTRSLLLLYSEADGWSRLSRWDEQYEALARVERGELSLSSWLSRAQEVLHELPETRLGGAQPFLISAATSAQEWSDEKPWDGFHRSIVVTGEETSEAFESYPVEAIWLDDIGIHGRGFALV